MQTTELSPNPVDSIDGVRAFFGLARIRLSLASQRSLANQRAGLTLIELLLVIAIIVVVAALSIPAIQRTLKSQGIRSGADRVRVAMGQARVKAIRSGEVHALFYGRDGAWFDVAPLSKYRDVLSRQNSREQQQKQVNNRDLEYDLLPKGVTFFAGQTGADSRSAAVAQEINGGSGVEMILFYPDGSAQDAQIMIRNIMGDVYRIELRGLTGSATAMRVDPQGNGR